MIRSKPSPAVEPTAVQYGYRHGPADAGAVPEERLGVR
jgi:hypothetical protein